MEVEVVALAPPRLPVVGEGGESVVAGEVERLEYGCCDEELLLFE